MQNWYIWASIHHLGCNSSTVLQAQLTVELCCQTTSRQWSPSSTFQQNYPKSMFSYLFVNSGTVKHLIVQIPLYCILNVSEQELLPLLFTLFLALQHSVNFKQQPCSDFINIFGAIFCANPNMTRSRFYTWVQSSTFNNFEKKSILKCQSFVLLFFSYVCILSQFC